MNTPRIEKAIYMAALRTIHKFGLKQFKKSTIFGRNDIVEEEKTDKAA